MGHAAISHGNGCDRGHTGAMEGLRQGPHRGRGGAATGATQGPWRGCDRGHTGAMEDRISPSFVPCLISLWSSRALHSCRTDLPYFGPEHPKRLLRRFSRPRITSAHPKNAGVHVAVSGPGAVTGLHRGLRGTTQGHGRLTACVGGRECSGPRQGGCWAHPHPIRPPARRSAPPAPPVWLRHTL